MTTKLNKRERKAAQLLAHYATCERLGKYLGMANPDGKKISVALFKIERDASKRSVQYCNGECTSEDWQACKVITEVLVEEAIGRIPPGFFVNSDARGYTIKIDNERPEGKALIDTVRMHTDWGGYGILAPEITGD